MVSDEDTVTCRDQTDTPALASKRSGSQWIAELGDAAQHIRGR